MYFVCMKEERVDRARERGLLARTEQDESSVDRPEIPQIPDPATAVAVETNFEALVCTATAKWRLAPAPGRPASSELGRG